MNTLDEEKLFYERFWALLSNPLLMQVFERFGPAAFRRSSVLEGFERFIATHGFRGETCLEIGTCKGLTAIVLSRFFRRVVTVDILDDPLKWQIADYLGVTNVEFVNVADNVEKASVIRALEFDAAYVDGDHAHDTDADFDLTRRCGRVLFHEYWDAQPVVVRLVDSLRPNVQNEGKLALWTA